MFQRSETMLRKNKKSQTKKIPTRSNAVRYCSLQAWLKPNLVCDFLACAPRSRRSRRAQMEAIGITIIVVLVLIGVLFGIQFVIKQKPVSVGSEFKRSQVAANFLSTLADTTTPECNGLSFSQLVQYCVKVTQAPCGINACDKAKQVATDVLTLTLDAWNMQYNLTVRREGTGLNIDEGEGCPGAKETKTYSISVYPSGIVTMQLDLC